MARNVAVWRPARGSAAEVEDDAPAAGAKKNPRNLIFVTHGWATDAGEWVSEFVEILEVELRRRDLHEEWLVKPGDWGEVSGDGKIRIYVGGEPIGFHVTTWPFFELGPTAAAEIARIMGEGWARKIEQEMGVPEIAHLIAHSANCHAVERMSAILQAAGSHVHLTLLDAYVPRAWPTEGLFGEHADVAEHYRDLRTFGDFGVAGTELPGS